MITAATRSRIECIASERIPRLPVIAARKTFSVTSTTAEPTEPSAAMRFSRLACSIVVEAIRGIIGKAVAVQWRVSSGEWLEKTGGLEGAKESEEVTEKDANREIGDPRGAQKSVTPCEGARRLFC